MFYSFDGIDGAGKSTQMELFCAWLAERGQRVVTCRDPGSTSLGEAIRSLLLDRHDLSIGRRAEAFLYMAARAQLVEQTIRPALERGETVVCDRFLLANVVYQGHAGGLDVAELWRIGQLATGGLEPDLTFVLDLAPEAAAKRIDRRLDRMESQGDEFRRRLRDGFRTEAARRPDKIKLIDADRAIDAVQSDIRGAVENIGTTSAMNVSDGSLSSRRLCPECNGSGIDKRMHSRFTTGGRDDRSCPRCHGECYIEADET
jgi:dTMP kinase